MSYQAGDLTQAKQQLEESLQMERSLHGDRDHPDIAKTLLALGSVSYQAGDLTQAKQQLGECLRILRSLHGDRDHPDIVGILYFVRLGELPGWRSHPSKAAAGRVLANGTLLARR